MKRYIWLILIIIGIIIICYPKFKDTYYQKKEREVLENWSKVSKQLDIGDEVIDEDVVEVKGEDEDIQLTDYMEGIINIEKIELYEPILKGATEYNLNIGVASVEGTDEVGEVGNYVIAGHRSRRYGRHFNRLGELEKGDIVEIITKEVNYRYEVYDKFIVKSEDVWVLKGEDEKKNLTLITCDYSMKPTGRLIIRGQLMEEVE